MYPIASISTDAVSVLPKGATSCCRAAILSPSFSFLTLKGGHEAGDSKRDFLAVVVVGAAGFVSGKMLGLFASVISVGKGDVLLGV